MKKILSICFLWAISCALWGQTRSGYGGDFNPNSPDNPKEPGLTLKYDFKVTAEKGGYVNCDPSGSQFTAGTNIYLNANPNTGYQFKCWMEKDSVISTSQWHYYTMPARDVELKAVFVFQPQVPNNPEVIPLDYRVTVEASPSYAGNVDCSREEVKVGSYTYVSASPYSGYKFAGWMLDGKQVSTDSYYHFEMESRNMHFIAMFEFNPDVPGNPSNNPNGSATYLLKYTIDGQVCHTEQLPEGAPITAIATPEKKGYTFSGWSAFPTVMPAHEVVISGSFIPNKYHVTYKVDGAVIHEEDVDYGTKLTPPEGEKKEGYTLTWTNLPDAMPDYDLVVEGTYVANVYSLTYIVDAQVYKNYEVVFATEITPEQEPVKEGHTFSGWDDVPKTMPAKDVVVTGTFSVNSYTITYMVDGKEYAKDTVAYGSEIVLPETPTKEGYTFSGWNDVPKTMPAKDVVVTGTFSVNSYTITYMVDGKEYAKDTVAYGSEIVLPETPTKEGYTFSGWNDVPKTMPAKDVVVTGSFSVNSYTITYMVDGERYKSIVVEYGATIMPEEAPVKEGHTFSGWSEIPETMPAEDLTVTGSFTINMYLVVFKIGDEVISSDSLPYGSPIVVPGAPEKEGHTFSGWGEVLQYVPAYDVTFVGSYTVNVYKVYYYVGEELVHTEEVAYGAAMPSYEYEPGNGDVFNGWDGEQYDTMPAHDVVYIANITSSISFLQSSDRKLVVYDLNGRRIHNLNGIKSGLYIVNGKRVLLK